MGVPPANQWKKLDSTTPILDVSFFVFYPTNTWVQPNTLDILLISSPIKKTARLSFRLVPTGSANTKRDTHINICNYRLKTNKQTNNRERRRRIYRKIPGNLKGRVKETTPGVTWMWKQWKTHTKMAAYKFCVLLGRDVSERAEWNHATWIRFSLSRSPFFLFFFCTWRRLPTPGPQVRNLQLFSTAMNWTQPLSHVRSVAHTRVPVFLSLFQCDSGANRLENATTSEKIPCGRSEIITQQQSRG